MRHLGAAIAAVFVLALAPDVDAQQLDRGLIQALDRIGGNLLGAEGFDAVLINPPEPVADPPDPVAPERLRVYLNPESATAVEIIVVRVDAGGEVSVAGTPPEPVRAFFRATVGGPSGIKLEFDPTLGEIIPCVTPADLSGIEAAPPDAGNVKGAIRAGLVTALAEVGANLLGAGAFDAVLSNPPDPVSPQTLRVFISKTAQIEFVLNNPPDPVMPPLAHIFVTADTVTVKYDLETGGTRGLNVEEADLSGVTGN